MSIFYYNNYFRYIKSRKACLRGAFVSYEGLTNSIRAFSRTSCSPGAYAGTAVSARLAHQPH